MIDNKKIPKCISLKPKRIEQIKKISIKCNVSDSLVIDTLLKKVFDELSSTEIEKLLN